MTAMESIVKGRQRARAGSYILTTYRFCPTSCGLKCCCGAIAGKVERIDAQEFIDVDVALNTIKPQVVTTRIAGTGTGHSYTASRDQSVPMCQGNVLFFGL